jgi:hypothetical protein
MATTPSAPLAQLFAPGTRVQVFCRFDNRWVSGFVVSHVLAAEPGSLRVVRVSDGALLPGVFPVEDVRLDLAPAGA